jgi:hypothetical protein
VTDPAEIYSLLAQCRMDGVGLEVVYRRRDRSEYQEHIRSSFSESQAQLSRADGGRTLQADPRAVQFTPAASPTWVQTSEQFIYRLDGSWKVISEEDAKSPRVIECAGPEAPVLFNGQPLNAEDPRGFSGAWRLHVEPGLRHMLQPAVLVACCRIIAAREVRGGSEIECEVAAVNVDLLSTPVISPWADQWWLTLDARTGWVTRSVAERDGQVVVEHELTVSESGE